MAEGEQGGGERVKWEGARARGKGKRKGTEVRGERSRVVGEHMKGAGGQGEGERERGKENGRGIRVVAERSGANLRHQECVPAARASWLGCELEHDRLL